MFAPALLSHQLAGAQLLTKSEVLPDPKILSIKFVRPLFFRQMAIIIFSNEELLLVACQLDCIGDESSNNQPDVISWRHSVVMSQVSRVTPRYSGYPGQWPSSEQVLTNKTQLRGRSIKRQKIRQRKLLCSPKLIFLAGHS